MTQQVQPPEKQKTPREKIKEALMPVLEHPFWAKLPKAFYDGLDFLENAEFNEALADRIENAFRCLVEHGFEIGEPEEAFLAAARAEFAEKKGFWATTIDFAQSVASYVDPNDKRTPKQIRDHADLVHFIFIAARNKPEILEILNNSLYKDLDPSVNNPNLDKLLDELIAKGLLQTQTHKKAVKAMLSPFHANWTAERCEAASKAFAIQDYFRDYDLVRMRRLVEHPREIYVKVADKILPVARGLRIFYAESMVLRFEAVCYTLHSARLSHPA